MRGFRRANPASNPVPKESSTNTNSKKHSKPTASTEATEDDKAKPKPPGSTRSPPPETNQQPDSDSNSSGSEHDAYKGKYCHYFVNKGRCNYEERSGLKCKFEHKVAPMCNFGISCSRIKCMFSHPKINGNSGNNGNTGFLGNSRSFPTMMNPWQMVNPWMTAPQGQFPPNPWISQGKQNSQ